MIKKERVKHFDFAKRPNDPCFLMSVAKNIISFPDLKKRNFKLTKINMENVEGPYLLLVTHSSMVDFNIMLKATHPHKVNNVMTLEGFNTYTEPLMRSLGVLGTRKFISDMHLVKNIKYCIDKLGNIFVFLLYHFLLIQYFFLHFYMLFHLLLILRSYMLRRYLL